MSSKLLNITTFVIGMTLCLASTVNAMTDPMQPPGFKGKVSVRTQTAKPKWRLTSTLIGEHRRLATINGRTIKVGETIAGARLVDIQPAVVTLSYQSRSIVLRLLPSPVKRQRRSSME